MLNRAGWIIKGVILNNEQLFEDNAGIYVEMLSNSTNQVTIPIINNRNSEEQIEAKVIVGQGVDSSSFHTIQLRPIVFKKF